MTSHPHSPTSSRLAPPGAGLPKGEQFIIGKLAMPFMRLQLSQKKALAVFEKSGKEILAMAEPLDLSEITEPVLINRLPGMEDSSRNWSVEMTMEHIQVVTAAALYIIDKLEKNIPLDLPVRTQDVKPTGGIGLERVRSFRDYLAEVPERVANYDFASKATHPHPWFGPLKSMDWLRLIAFHQNLHRKQIARILKPAPC